jgi:hypothetical protein
MQAAMVVTWTEPVPGREMVAVEYGAEVTAYWTKQAEAGKCSPPEMFFSERGLGLWMVKGDRDTLLTLHDTDESQNLIMRGQLLLSDFSVDFYTAGAASDAFIARYANMAGALA